MAGREALLAGRRLFIFDLDGTLADSGAVHAAAFAEALGRPVDYEAIAGLGTGEAMRHLLAQRGEERDEAGIAALVAAKRRAAREGLAGVREIAGAAAFVTAAAARHRLALCTSAGPVTVEVSLPALGLAGRFDPVVTADDVARAKPEPDGFLLVLERAGVPAGEALIFEDSEAGLAAAAAAGIDAIRIGAGHADWPTLTAALA